MGILAQVLQNRELSIGELCVDQMRLKVHHAHLGYADKHLTYFLAQGIAAVAVSSYLDCHKCTIRVLVENKFPICETQLK